ncbi:MAG: AraC family transcriptional regulator [Rhizobiaceae bacterium]|nr:AraC family transcriptional regulator [Rhizobiaceae bacterium]
MNTARASTGTTRSVTYIRVSAFTPLMDTLLKSHVFLPPLLARHSISMRELKDPYALIPLHRYVAFLEDAAEAAGDPAFAARLGAHFKPADMGPMGILFSLAPTIRIAFERISKYVNALQSATNSGLAEEDGMIVWHYRISDRTIWPRRQDAEYSLAASCQLVRSCFSTSLNPLEVHFEHDRPENTGPLTRLFRAPIFFGQANNRLVYSVEDADRIYRSEDAQLTMILEHHLNDLIGEVQTQEAFSDKVRMLIQLYMGRRPVTTRFLAEELGISVRSLQRQLGAEGLSVRQLTREHRAELAAGLLEQSGTSVSDVAQALGYADSAVFSRAFKQWTGNAPRRLKRVTGPSSNQPDSDD